MEGTKYRKWWLEEELIGKQACSTDVAEIETENRNDWRSRIQRSGGGEKEGTQEIKETGNSCDRERLKQCPSSFYSFNAPKGKVVPTFWEWRQWAAENTGGRKEEEILKYFIV